MSAARKTITHPRNAGKPFTRTDDNQIRLFNRHGKSIEAMAKSMGRTYTGIRARMERLGLIQTPAQYKAATDAQAKLPALDRFAGKRS